MLDDSATLSDLKEAVRKFRDERDWLKFHNPKDLSMALSIESAELEELFLWKDKAEVDTFQTNQEKSAKVEDEIADIGIYLLSLADVMGLDLSEALLHKLETNKRRYPVEKFKGSNLKYSEARK